MKQLSSQKWILSTLLIAALGSQYYFSISSKNSGILEMSEMAAPEQAIIEVAAALDKTRPVAAVVVSGDRSRPASADITKRDTTEALSPAVPCADCVTLTKAEADKIRQILKEVTGKKLAVKASEDVPETAAERMKREREEREEKRREEKLAKDEKKRDAELAKKEKKIEEQDLRDERFRSDFERLSARCHDAECFASSLSTALSRYSDKSKMVSMKVVNEIFNENIAKDLKSGLKDPENSSAQAALEILMGDLPSAYRSLKTKTIDLAKSVTAPMAVEANASFKLAEQLRKANKLTESSAAFNRGMEQKSELEKTLRSQYEAIHDGTERGEDKTTYTYYNVNYAKPASQWLADIMNTSNFKIDLNDTTNNTANNPLINPNNPNTGRGVVRGGNNGNVGIGNQINNSIGSPNNSNVNMPNPNNNSIQFGTQQQGFRGGRGSY